MKTDAAVSGASRRAFLGTGLSSAIALLAPCVANAQESWIAQFANSRDAAFLFLESMMSAYVTNSPSRLIQSYSDRSFPQHPAIAFTYDNAVVLQAYLARGAAGDLGRAETLGNGLLAAQRTNFPVADGRFAQAYFVDAPNSSTGASVTPTAEPYPFYSSTVGDQAWAGMALAQLFHQTDNAAYLQGALRVGNWIVANAYSTIGPGGYSFGTTIDAQNKSVPSTNGKSTEHNIDTYAFFSMLARLTEDGNAANGKSWRSLAEHARIFVKAMFDKSGGFFYTGTDADQTTTAKANIPEDVQTWSYLALQDETYASSIDWAMTHLAATDKVAGNLRISGATFASESLESLTSDPHAVWLEGTAHLATAMLSRRINTGRMTPRSLRKADDPVRTLLASIRQAQRKLGAGQAVHGNRIPAYTGIPASTSILDTGFGFKYSPDLHIGATGWYVLALLGANPFQLGFRLL